MEIHTFADPDALDDALLRTGLVAVCAFGARPWTICAPHHARSGVSMICDPPRVADNGAGLVAARLAHALGARLVVACDPTGPDPNKAAGEGGPYQQALFDADPFELLIEVHGMGASSSPFDVELARGHNRYADCVQLGAKLQARLPSISIGRQGAERIRFTARSNHVLTRCDARGVAAYQLELEPWLRLEAAPAPDQIPARGVRLIDALAEALQD